MKKILTIATMLSVCFAVASCCGNSTKNAAAESADGCCASSKTAEAGVADGCCASSKTAECASACCENTIKIITAHKFIKADMVDEFIEFTRPIIELSRAEEGCISYTLYQDPSDPTKFIFYEQWKDQAAIDYHFSTDHFKKAGSRPDFEAAPTVLTIYDACPAK